MDVIRDRFLEFVSSFSPICCHDCQDAWYLRLYHPEANVNVKGFHELLLRESGQYCTWQVWSVCVMDTIWYMAKGHPKVGRAPIGFAVAAPCENLPEGIGLDIVLGWAPIWQPHDPLNTTLVIPNVVRYSYIYNIYCIKLIKCTQVHIQIYIPSLKLTLPLKIDFPKMKVQKYSSPTTNCLGASCYFQGGYTFTYQPVGNLC